MLVKNNNQDVRSKFARTIIIERLRNLNCITAVCRFCENAQDVFARNIPLLFFSVVGLEYHTAKILNTLLD